MDLDGVRTFVVAAELGQFQGAADELRITPQAVSKRIAALERHVGAVLFSRSAHGVQLTRAGRTFLPHARDLLDVADRARRSVQPEGRALRVDVTNRRIAPSRVLQDFHLAHPGVDVDVVTLADNNLAGALTAVHSGAVDVSFRAVTVPARDIPPGVSVARAIDHELQLLVGPEHPLAAESAIEPRCLAGHRIWIPGIVPGTEWATFYDDLAAAFGLTIDGRGPHFGDESLLERLCQASDLATLVGRRDRYLWPAHYDLRRIPVRNPTPIYPHSLIWLTANPHPGLGALREYLATVRRSQPHEPNVWLPTWAHESSGRR
ncbi:LysR family transcriptional regulator [Mycobacterium sp. 21AC1]|uniref:LysR family transcriptional regulator n=1 Tax=[Mycobacterium] appelbergii TaxID=2939269 RepID=UPI002938D2B6|nr:LysR family transcriptional regulator [Mycobacterium sp. 21AC1]MDV3127366.1 LysR family transcriptional regulator [Mycobacterium sp. 21AC1]